MPSKETEDQKLSARANELYWQSGMSVNQIAEDMDLSKSRLYGLVQPHQAENPCPECGSDLVFPNRTAMEKGFVSCASCSFEGEADGASREPRRELTIEARRKAPTPAGTTPVGSKEPAQRTTRVPTHTGPGAKRVLWGSALLGLAAGLYIAIRQRRSGKEFRI
jgi:predicted RNA-binding Zn-ribbon protein involved in translation (DUF1610 family)